MAISSSESIGDIKDVVEEELIGLHIEAIPQIVVRMTSTVIAADPTISKNAGFFLTGLAALNRPEVNKEIQVKVLQAKSDNPQYAQTVLRLLSSNGKLIIGVSKACLNRIKQVIAGQIETVKPSLSEIRFSHPVRVFVSLSKELGDLELVGNFKHELEKLFDERPYSEYLLSGLIDHPETTGLYFSHLVERAGSSTFDIANGFAYAIEKLDTPLSNLISDEQAFLLITATLKAANWGAFGSKGLKDTKFSAIPNIKFKAISHANSHKAQARAHLREELAIDTKISEFIAEYLSDTETA